MFQENFGLPRYFKVQRFCLKRIGLNFENGNELVTSYFWALLPFIAKVGLLISLLHFSFQNFDDLDQLTDAMAPTWQVSLSLVKWLTFMYKRNELRRLFSAIWASNLEANKAECAIIVKENERDVLLSRLYLIFVTSTGCLAVIKPSLLALTIFAHTGDFKLLPPTTTTFPLDLQNPWYYCIQFVWVCFAVYSVIYTSVGVDSMFSWISHNVIAQFDILHYHLQQTATQHDGNISKQSIKACIKYHNRILDKVQKLNDVFGLIIFAKFAMSCLQICVIAYQLTQIQNFAAIIYLATFLIAVALQIFIYCYLGQRIKDESSNVSEYVYNAFEWEKVDVASRKLLLMPMIRAQRSSSLSGIFFVVDFILYMWVLKTACSYITLLLSLDEKKGKA